MAEASSRSVCVSSNLNPFAVSRARAVLGQFTWDSPLAWHLVHARHPLADVRVSINDVGATPAVVSLRLDQAVAQMRSAQP